MLLDYVRVVQQIKAQISLLHKWVTVSEYLICLFLLVPDPFADAIKGSEEGVQDGFVHIRIQQRNGRKTLTTVQGLSSEYDLKKIVRACKKVCTRRYKIFSIIQF